MAVLKALIFDFDGLIIDTESVGYETWRKLFADHGHELETHIYASVIGSDFGVGYDPRRDLEQRTGLELDWEQIETGRKQHEHDLRQSLRLLPGVLNLLQQASELGLPCAVASSSPRSWVKDWLTELELLEHFHHLTTIDDTGKAKPDPALFQLASQRLDIPPESALIFEDSLNGLNAAKAAGIRCISVPGPMTQHLDFNGSWRRLRSLEEADLNELIETFPRHD